MNTSRLKRSLSHLHRTPELIECVRKSPQASLLMLAFLGIHDLKYPFIMKTPGGHSVELCDWNDLTTVWVVFFGGEYKLRGDEDTIVDLGANIGAFSIHAAECCPDAKIWALEPFPDTIQRLERNLRLSTITDRIEIVPRAVDAVSRCLYMLADTSIPSHSRQVSERSDQGIVVQTMTLEELLENCGGRIDYLKVDIEGHETELFLNTSRRVLGQVRRIGMEYHGRANWAQLRRHFGSIGFRVAAESCRGEIGTATLENLGA